MTKKFSSDRYENLSAPAHDDMLGILGTGLATSNQWNVKNINDTLYPLGFLRDNSNDYVIVRIQSPHWRKQGQALDSIHIHCINDSIITAGQTIVFTTYWTWLSPDTTIPSISSWNTVNKTITYTSNVPAWTYSLINVVDTPAAPSVEGYGMYILCRVVRGNGTWAGELGILDMDAHAQKDRLGSVYEAWDVE
jgi:hypothetical protein